MTIIVEPARPTFLADKNTTNQTGIGSDSNVLVTFSNALINIGSYFDTVNSKWTPPAGRIIIGGKLYTTGTTAAGNFSFATIYKDGAAAMSGPMPCSANLTVPQVIFEDQASGTNYYQLYIYIQLTSGTATVAGDITATQFYGHWIGP